MLRIRQIKVPIESDNIKIYLHPVEVKIGQNSASVISKANNQVINTYNGLWNALWPKEEKDILERKLSRNFFIQLQNHHLFCCENLFVPLLFY